MVIGGDDSERSESFHFSVQFLRRHANWIWIAEPKGDEVILEIFDFQGLRLVMMKGFLFVSRDADLVFGNETTLF